MVEASCYCLPSCHMHWRFCDDTAVDILKRENPTMTMVAYLVRATANHHPRFIVSIPSFLPFSVRGTCENRLSVDKPFSQLATAPVLHAHSQASQWRPGSYQIVMKLVAESVHAWKAKCERYNERGDWIRSGPHFVALFSSPFVAIL